MDERSRAFRVLGIAPDSDPAAISRAYHRLARRIHPDVSSDPNAADEFTALSNAYRLLRRQRTRPAQSRVSPASGRIVPVRVNVPQARHVAIFAAGPAMIRPFPCETGVGHDG